MKLLLPLYLPIILLLFSTVANARHILVIESYHAEFDWDKDYKKALTDTLGNKHRFSFFEMDTKRLPRKTHKYRAELAWDFYKRLQPDLVVLGDDNALKFLGPKLKKTSTPVIYLGINNNPRNYDIGDAANITGVLERPLIKRSILSTQKIVKNLKRVLILTDSSPSSVAAISGELGKNKTVKISDIEIDIKFIAQYSSWQQTLSMAKEEGYDAVFIGLFFSIKGLNNQHVNSDKILQWTVKNTPLPLFGFWSFSIGKGKTAGGLVIEGYQQGLEAAKMIEAVFSGKPIFNIRPKMAQKGHYLFSRTELDKYQLVIPTDIAQFTTWLE